jgi:hypothetical protein
MILRKTLSLKLSQRLLRRGIGRYRKKKEKMGDLRKEMLTKIS